MMIISRKKILFFIALSAVFFLAFSFSFAQTADELRDKISESDNEISQLENEIEAFEKELDVLDEERHTLDNSIQKLNVTRNKLSTDIKVTQKKINTTSLVIDELNIDINDKIDIIDQGKQGISESMRKINVLDANNMLELLLSTEKISDVWNEVESLQSFQDQVNSHMRELRFAKRELEGDKEEKEDVKSQQLAFKEDLGDQKKIVDQNKKEKNTLLTQTKNKESNFQKLIKEKLAKKSLFEKAIEEFESQLKFILDPNALPGEGALRWPLDFVLITQKFGRTVDSVRLYASGTHSGVDFRASTGTKLRAMGNGTILGTGDTDLTCSGASWGKWVTIEYDNGLASTFGHLSLIKASKGDRVSTGDVVGFTGNTGHSTAPHLHTTVYAGSAVQISQRPSSACTGKTYTIPLAARNAYVDPLTYLPPTTPSMFK